MAHPDLQAMSQGELISWKLALDAAAAAAGAGDDFDVAILADDEGVSVTFTILFAPSPT